MSFSALASVDTLQDTLDPVSALVDECKIRQQSVDGSGIEGQTTLDGDVVRERDER